MMFWLTSVALAAEGAPADSGSANAEAKSEGKGEGKADGKKAEKPSVKVSGVLYANYGVDLSEGADFANAFDLERAYLRADGTVSDAWRVRLTLDSNRQKDAEVEVPDGLGGSSTVIVPADTRLRTFVKHAYLEWRSPEAKGLRVRGGIVDTSYIGVEEDVMQLRWVGKTALDQLKIEDTADFGITGGGKHAKGLVSWQAAILNGEGYTNPEVDAGKALQARFTLDPLASGKKAQLPITAFVEENLHTGADPTLTWAGGIGYKQTGVAAYAHVFGQSEGAISGLGQAIAVSPEVPEVVRFLARLDRWDPDGATNDDGEMRLVGGVLHDFAEKVSLGLTYEHLMPEDPAASDEMAAFLRMQAGF